MPGSSEVVGLHMPLGQGCAVSADAPASIYLVFPCAWLSPGQAGGLIGMELGVPLGKPRANAANIACHLQQGLRLSIS